MSSETPADTPVLLLLPDAAVTAVGDWAGRARTIGAEMRSLIVTHDWLSELRVLRAQHPGRLLIRVRQGALWLADDALARLVKAARGHTGAVLPMANNSPELTPAAPDTELLDGDPAAIDAALFALSERALVPMRASDPPLWALGADATADDEAALLDHLYVHAPGVPVRGLPTPADRRERAPAHPLAAVRSALLDAGQAAAAPWPQAGRSERPVVLHVLHGWGGGAERFVHDLALADASREHLLLRATGSPMRKQHGEWLELSAGHGGPVLRRALLSPAIPTLADRHSGYAAVLADVIGDFAVEQLVVSSLIGHALDVLRTGLPVLWVAHDYFPLWPALHRDFGDPAAAFDEAELVADLRGATSGPFRETDADFWRQRRAATVQALLDARAQLVAPSASVLRNIARMVPPLAALPQRVIPHGLARWNRPADAAGNSDAVTAPEPGGRLRLCVIGRINGGKGLELLRQIAREIGSFAELFLVGSGKAAEALFGIGGVHVLLDYQREELPAILARIRPHAALLPVTVAETFSYTLSELWSLGLVPIASKLGALAERIEDGVNGILVAPTAEAWLERIKVLDQDRAPLDALRAHIAGMPARDVVAALADYAPLLPAGTRVALRYSVRASDPRSLALAVETDARTDAQLRLRDAEQRVAEQQAELERRAHWGFDLAKQVEQRTTWAQSLEAEVQRTRAWLAERENVFAQNLEHYESQRVATEAALQNVQEEFSRHMEEARAIQTRLDERIVHVEHLNQSLNQTLTDRTSELQALSDAHLQLQHVRNELIARRDELEASRAALQAEHEALNYSSQYLQRLVEHLRYERDAVTAHREQILSSTSWKLTTPLRAAGLFAKRVRTSLAFRTQRLLSLFGRLRSSIARRGFTGTLARARQELRDRNAQYPAAISVSTPEPASEYAALSIPVSAAPLVSIVIPVYNQLHHTMNCLSALAETAGTTPFEVIVVDDGSADATALEVPRVQGVRFHKNPENLGFIGACNAGADLARGKYLFFLNNDTAVQPGWLEPLVKTFSDFDRVGLVGSKLVYPDGRLQEAGGIVFADGSGWNYGRFDHPDDPRYDYPREVDYCSGAAILIERELFARFGGFDSLYKPAYYEDTDLGFKVRAAGLRVIYQPASRVVHFEGITGGTDPTTGIKRFQVVNQAKFKERWADALTRQPAPTDHDGIWRAATHRAGGRILMIDATTATPDQDSGSLRYVNLLRVLHSMGWQATFFADNRAYIPRYTEELRALGVEVQFHPWLSDPVAFFRDRGRQFDVVMLSRHYVARHYVDLVREYAPQARLLFDTVDLHYLREQRAAAVDGSEAMARQATATREAELELVRRCDATIVVSPVEQELLGREVNGHRVEVLSNIHQLVGRRAGFAERRDIWFVGGFQHQPNVDAMQWFVADIWPRVRPELPEVVFHIVGSKMPPEIAALAGNGIEVHGFVSDLDRFLDGCRFAVAPLRYGAGVKGKVNQSMAHGQPVVATPIAVEGMAIESGKEALVADSAEHFAEAMVRLYRDADLWQTLSDNGLANTREHFSFEAAQVALARILRG